MWGMVTLLLLSSCVACSATASDTTTTQGMVWWQECYHRCDRLFYELHLNLSLPCDLRPNSQEQQAQESTTNSSRGTIETTCLNGMVPQLTAPSPEDNENWDAPSIFDTSITNLDILELNVDLDVTARETVQGYFFTGFSILYESPIPNDSRGLQVIATASTANQKKIVQSWTIHLVDHDNIELGSKACVEQSHPLTIVAGWATTVSVISFCEFKNWHLYLWIIGEVQRPRFASLLSFLSHPLAVFLIILGVPCHFVEPRINQIIACSRVPPPTPVSTPSPLFQRAHPSRSGPRTNSNNHKNMQHIRRSKGP